MKLQIEAISALTEHKDALLQSKHTLAGEVAAILDAVSRIVADAKEGREAAADDVRYAADALAMADDDDDTEYLKEELEEADRKHSEWREYSDEVSTRAARFRKQIGDHEQGYLHSLGVAIQSIEKQAHLYRSYQGIEMSGRGSSRGRRAGKGSTSGESRKSLANLPPLPNNTRWVALEDMDWEDLPSDLPFEKAEKQKIKEMMKVFQTEVVPILKSRKSIDHDYLVRLDQAAGISPTAAQGNPQSLAFAWRCLVTGDDTIVLDAPNQYTGDRYSWTSGRHRSIIARELGWTHLPARVLGGQTK